MGLGAYGHALGITFHIDDVLDITAKQSELRKPVGGDIQRGIMTLPMILALEKSREKDKLRELLSERVKSQAEIENEIKLIRASGAIEESMFWVNQYIRKAQRHLLELPEGPDRRALAELADFIGVRKF